MEYSILLKKDFLKNITFTKKSFLICASDEILLNKKISEHTVLSIYFKLEIIKNDNNLQVVINLYAWSNNNQKLVPIKDSLWSWSKDKEKLLIIESHYKTIIENFFSIFKYIENYWQLKELIHKIETKSFLFHYKILNIFQKEIIENIMLKEFKIYQILNIPLLKNKLYKDDIPHLFLPNYVDVIYFNGMKISVDFDDSDFAVIENVDTGILISQEEFMKNFSSCFNN